MNKKIKKILQILCIAIFVALMICVVYLMNKPALSTGNVAEAGDSVFDLAAKGETEEIMKRIKSGTDINVKSEDNGRTLLHYAAAYGQTNLAKKLISEGIMPDVKDAYGDTPVMLSVFNGDTELYKTLENIAELSVKDAAGNTLLHLCAQSGNAEIFDSLTEHGLSADAVNNAGNKPYCYAKDIKMIDRAMSCSSDVLNPDTANKILLCVMSEESVSYALQNGAEINAADESGFNSLYYALMNGNIKVFELLLKKGIDPDYADASGNTALHICAYNDLGDFARILLAFNADKSIKTKDGLSAYRIARQYGSQSVLSALAGTAEG